MKLIRGILYVLILSTLFLVPLNRVEIANLKPVQAVWMHLENGNVVLLTDTEDMGAGASVKDALSNMKQKSNGIVYLDTAEYLFVASSAIERILDVRPYMKPSVRLCVWDGEGEFKDAVQYVDSHKIGIKLNEWNGVGILPELNEIKQ